MYNETFTKKSKILLHIRYLVFKQSFACYKDCWINVKNRISHNLSPLKYSPKPRVRHTYKNNDLDFDFNLKRVKY